MNKRMGLAAVVAVGLPLWSAGAAMAQSVGTDEKTVQQKLEEQEQRLKTLERKLELKEEEAKAAATSAATVKAEPKGFTLQSADTKTNVKIKGNFAFDGRWFKDDITPSTADTWLLRKVRPSIEGTINGVYDFRFVPDFASGRTIILDAYAAAKLRPWAVITAGKFKGPIGLERLQPDQYNRFVELALPSVLVPNRDIGVQFSGSVADNLLTYQIGYFNGVTDGASSDSNASPDLDNDAKKEWEGRVFLQPFATSENFVLRNFGIGIGGGYGKSTGNATTPLIPGYRTPGQQSFFSYRAGATPTFADGERVRYSPQLYYSVGRFSVLGEYVASSIELQRVNGLVTRTDKIKNTAWQGQFAWFITGEDESYNTFTPNSTFQPGKPGLGAWELAARYHQLNIDDAAFDGGADSFANLATAARKATAWGVGINWYLNQNLKWVLNYEVTEFEGGAASGDRPDEKTLFTRVAFVF